MPGSPRYLFDADVLINSKNIHYQPAFCEPFWDWIIAGHEAGAFFSIDKVKGELLNGDKKDPLYSWCQGAKLAKFFLDTKECVSKWGDLSKWVTHADRPYVRAAKEKFLHPESADAWLIAHAAHTGNFLIITNETSQPECKSKVKIPDAAAAMGVSTTKLHDVLAKHATKFFSFQL
jgi:hypothetical protein